MSAEEDELKLTRMYAVAQWTRQKLESEHVVVISKDEEGMLTFCGDSIGDGELEASLVMAHYGGMCLSTFANLFVANISPENRESALAHFVGALEGDINNIFEAAGLIETPGGRHIN